MSPNFCAYFRENEKKNFRFNPAQDYLYEMTTFRIQHSWPQAKNIEGEWRKRRLCTPNFREQMVYVQTKSVLRIRFRVRIHRIFKFLGLPDPDPLVRGMGPDPALDPDLDPSIIRQKLNSSSLEPGVRE